MERTFIFKRLGIPKILRIYDDSATPEGEFAKWPPEQQAEIDVTSFVEVDPLLLPDQLYADAWEGDYPDITVNLTKAQAIQKWRVKTMCERLIRGKRRTQQVAERIGDVDTIQICIDLNVSYRIIADTFDPSSTTTTTELRASWPKSLPGDPTSRLKSKL